MPPVVRPRAAGQAAQATSTCLPLVASLLLAMAMAPAPVAALPPRAPFTGARCYELLVADSGTETCNSIMATDPGVAPLRFKSLREDRAHRDTTIRFGPDGLLVELWCRGPDGEAPRASFQAKARYAGVVPSAGWTVVEGGFGRYPAPRITLGGRCESDCPPCGEKQYESTPCMFGKERVCADCTECGEGQFQVSPCTPAGDATCMDRESATDLASSGEDGQLDLTSDEDIYAEEFDEYEVRAGLATGAGTGFTPGSISAPANARRVADANSRARAQREREEAAGATARKAADAQRGDSKKSAKKSGKKKGAKKGRKKKGRKGKGKGKRARKQKKKEQDMAADYSYLD